MTLSLDEIQSFVTSAEGLLVNLGTFDQERREAATIAIDTALQHQLPWVLDPVFVDRAQSRAEFARKLIGCHPTVIRLNHPEFLVLTGNKPSSDAAMTYARGNRTVIGLSGKKDLVTDGERVVSIANGHPLMAKVTAIGCATSALVAACLSFEPDALQATVAALVIVGIAGELAAERSPGPGTFAAAFIDCLYSLDEPTLLARAQVC
jgi:hydroxyethylthiazole kinase